MTTNPHRFRFAYPARLTLDEDGRILIEFPDFPFAATDAADMEDVGTQGTDCLEEALAVCIDEGLPIPVPPDDLDSWPFDKSSGDPDDWGRAVLTPGPVIAAKAALYQAVRDAGITKVALAAQLEIGEKEVRRMLDPRHPTKIQTIDRALAALGKRLEITVRDIPGHKQVA